MPETKPKPKSGIGKGLKRKLGPLPVYAYLLAIVVVIAFIIYKKRQGQSLPVGGAENQQVIPIAIPSGGQSGRGVTTGTSSTGGSDTTPTPVEFPSDYVTSTDFQSGLNDLGNSIGASIASITFPEPNITITPAPVTVVNQTAKSKTAAKKAAHTSAPSRYYTHKKDVPLKAGQSLHFKKGRGYYAGS